MRIIGYLLAVLSAEHKIDHNALCFLGNHEHTVSQDREGRIPDFWRDFHARLAQHLNATFGDAEPLWNSKQTSTVRPVQPEDILGRIAYTMANPVKHGLVKFARTYPGLRMAWPCKPRTFKRPAGFLDANAKREDGSPRWPEEATLTMHRPQGFEHLSDAELALLIAERCKAEEDRRRSEFLATGRKFLGRRALRKRPRRSRPKNEPRSEISPKIACRDRDLRKKALAALKAWLADYRNCLERLRNGDSDVEFPYGTYKLRHSHAVAVRAAPT